MRMRMRMRNGVVVDGASRDGTKIWFSFEGGDKKFLGLLRWKARGRQLSNRNSPDKVEWPGAFSGGWCQEWVPSGLLG